MTGMSIGETVTAQESVFLNSSAQAQGKPVGPAITQAKLANGLDIVVIPDRRAPVVTHMVWYRNGSA
ncbi:MAG: insulinase family protein, partial [Methylocella sp.]